MGAPASERVDTQAMGRGTTSDVSSWYRSLPESSAVWKITLQRVGSRTGGGWSLVGREPGGWWLNTPRPIAMMPPTISRSESSTPAREST